MATYKVGYFVGSLAPSSINRLLAKALVGLTPPELVMRHDRAACLPRAHADGHAAQRLSTTRS